MPEGVPAGFGGGRRYGHHPIDRDRSIRFRWSALRWRAPGLVALKLKAPRRGAHREDVLAGRRGRPGARSRPPTSPDASDGAMTGQSRVNNIGAIRRLNQMFRNDVQHRQDCGADQHEIAAVFDGRLCCQSRARKLTAPSGG